jgi:hypothetical protein
LTNDREDLYTEEDVKELKKRWFELRKYFGGEENHRREEVAQKYWSIFDQRYRES